ncbi:tetratricopeptide repeat protein [Natronospora cellulosivora (SeqCode)]
MDEILIKEIANEIKALHVGAIRAINNNDYTTAERNYRKALLITEKIKYYEGMALTLYNMANLSILQGDLIEAINNAADSCRFYKKAGTINRNSTELLNNILIKSKNLAIRHEKKREFKKAIKLFAACLPFANEKDAKALKYEIKLLEKIMKNERKGKEEMSSSKKIADLLKELNHLAVQELAQANYEKAIEVFKESEKYESNLGLKEQAIKTKVNIANTYYLLKEYKKAIEYLKQVLSFYKNSNDLGELSAINDAIGNNYYQLREYTNAIECFYKCVKAIKSDPKLGAYYYKIALSNMMLKNYDKAQETFAYALQEFERVKDQQGLIDTLRQRSVLFKEMGMINLAQNDIYRMKHLLANIN